MVQVPSPQPFREFITDLSYGLSFFFRLFILNLALQILCSLKNKTLSTFTIVLMYDKMNQDYLWWR